METHQNKYKILVLSDLKGSVQPMLKSTISLSKMIDGSIELFHVKKPTDIVEMDNQLSAMRGINHEHNAIEAKIKSAIAPVADEYGVNIHYNFSIGNVKDEITRYIDKHRPNIIVLGKKKRKAINFIGDGVTQFVLNKHNGAVMIADQNNVLEPDKALSLGSVNAIGETFDLEFADDLMKHVQRPYKSFKMVKSYDTMKASAGSNNRVIDYIFEQADNSTKNMSKYLSKSNVNLLYIDRARKGAKTKPYMLESNILEAIESLKVSLIVASGPNYRL